VDADATVVLACYAAGLEDLSRRLSGEFDVAVIGSRHLDETVIGVAADLMRTQRGCCVLLQSEHATAAAVQRVRRLGLAYLSKTAAKCDFMLSLARLLDIEIPDVDSLVAKARKKWSLSRQQTKLLYYNLWSCSNDEIAQSLGLSLNTVQEYQQKLRHKTGAKSKDSYFRLLLECSGRKPPECVSRSAGG
jgi:DNA-binding NarL/FixJ family response regulator